MDDISEYELIIVGSGMQVERWTDEPEDFLKKFQKDLAQKKVAIFVSSGVQAIFKYEGKTDAMDRAWRKYLVEKAAKYSLNPIALGLFGGIWDYKMGFLARKTMSPFKEKIEAAGFKETKPVSTTPATGTKSVTGPKNSPKKHARCNLLVKYPL